eukprot:scaffold69950_cov15-Tisochrysis_lutea.AAC.1
MGVCHSKHDEYQQQEPGKQMDPDLLLISMWGNNLSLNEAAQLQSGNFINRTSKSTMYKSSIVKH